MSIPFVRMYDNKSNQEPVVANEITPPVVDTTKADQVLEETSKVIDANEIPEANLPQVKEAEPISASQIILDSPSFLKGVTVSAVEPPKVFKLDAEKIKTIDDVKAVFAAMDMRLQERYIEGIRHLVTEVGK
jgi:hypothetical protein